MRNLLFITFFLFTQQSHALNSHVVDIVINKAVNEIKKAQNSHSNDTYLPNNPYSSSQNSSQLSNNSQSCSLNYYANTTPVIINSKLSKKTQDICFDGFAVKYSYISKTALWSAEHLTVQRLEQAKLLPRNDNFHEENQINGFDKPLLSDYIGSGYDRGHLSPNADMQDTRQQYDSFSLANIIPQDPELNRGAWADMEKQVRYNTLRYGESYVVTGVIFDSSKTSAIKNKIFIPTAMYKAVFYPSKNKVEVYFAQNNSSNQVDIISLDRLIQISGVNPFPTLANATSSINSTSIQAEGETSTVRSDFPTDTGKPLNSDIVKTNEDDRSHLLLLGILGFVVFIGLGLGFYYYLSRKQD